VIAPDAGDPARLWAAGADRLMTSEDRGARWQPMGRPLPEANTMVQGIVAAGRTIVLATARGLYRSADGGDDWKLVTENVPAHAEAKFLVGDPADAATLYAGFAAASYSELWRQAGDSVAARRRTGLVGVMAFLVLVAVIAGLTLRRLARHDRTPPEREAPARAPRGPDGAGSRR
jgi:hypothetical protein